MRLARRLANAWQSLTRPSALERDAEREVAAARAILEEELLAEGFSSEDARRRVRIEFGDPIALREAIAEVRPGQWLRDWWRDTRMALRTLRRLPAMAAAMLTVLALGIGATSGIYAVVHAVLMQPLTYAEPERLVSLWERRDQRGDEPLLLDGTEYAALVESAGTLASIGVMHFGDHEATLTGAGDPLALSRVRASASMLPTLGVRMAVGRGFTVREDAPGHEPVAVLSHALWQDRFGGDPAVVGRAIRVSEQAVVVVGVLPAGFRMPAVMRGLPEPDLWMPIAEPLYGGRHYLFAIARLAPAATVPQAQQEVASIAARVSASNAGNRGHGARLVPLDEQIVGRARTGLATLLGAVFSLWLIACVNAASLVLSAVHGRARELAVRAALGAGRFRLVRQLAAECLVLGIGGGAGGALVAATIIDAAPRLAPLGIPRLDELQFDGQVVAALLVLSLSSAAVCATAALAAGRRALSRGWLRDAARGIGATPDRQRLRRALVAGEVAVTITLLAGAGLLLGTFVRLNAVDAGFNGRRLATADVSLPAARYGEPDEARRFYASLVDSLHQIPGVESVGATTHVPLSEGESGMPVDVDGYAPRGPDDRPRAAYRVVTPGYFRTLGIPLLAGRNFAASDARQAVPLIRWYPQQPAPRGFDEPQPPPVAIVNLALARRYWPNRDAVGGRLRLLFSPWITVIGVVADVRDQSLRTAPEPQVYLLDLQEPQRSLSVVVRTSGDAAELSVPIEAALRRQDPDLALRRFRTVAGVRAESIAEPRLLARAVGAFALVALCLTAAGIGGLVAFAVRSRASEFGVRVALGADPSRLVRGLTLQTLRPVVVGAACGLAGSLALSQALEGLLFGVTPTDPATLAAVVGLLLLIGTVASYLPARAIMALDPLDCLRQE